MTDLTFSFCSLFIYMSNHFIVNHPLHLANWRPISNVRCTLISQVRLLSPLIMLQIMICPVDPYDENSHPISLSAPPPACEPLDITSHNPFYPFEDWLAFEFANYHFSQEQTLKVSIDWALQLWATQSAKNGYDDVPWKSANEMYHTIDQIQQGDNPWKTVSFCY